MKIYISSVYVDDQEKALRFYTEVLGFVKKIDVPAGEYRCARARRGARRHDSEARLGPS
jgi:uncharacterized glyoxalase superfamily protein PhnB